MARSGHRRSDLQNRDLLDVTVGRDVRAVVEEDHAVAQQAPTLLAVVGYWVRLATVPVIDVRARRLVDAHRSLLR
jgi:hypothetical protein